MQFERSRNVLQFGWAIKEDGKPSSFLKHYYSFIRSDVIYAPKGACPMAKAKALAQWQKRGAYNTFFAAHYRFRIIKSNTALNTPRHRHPIRRNRAFGKDKARGKWRV
jgi:hypothetical protein